LALADEDLQFGLHALAVLAAGVLPFATGFMMTLAVVAVVWLISAMAARKTSRGAILPYLGIPYAAGSTMALMILGNDVANGPLAIVWLLAIVWTADSLAYFSGRIIGGPRLAPSISPKKTWAGMAGAVAGGVLASLAVAVLAGLESRVFLALLGGLLAIVEQGGDLFKSALKRFYGVKDAGRLIPGHGGVMDRVDGLVAAAMVGALIGTLHSGSGAAGAGLLHW
jgi:phosphatidate cytidylyltransferase